MQSFDAWVISSRGSLHARKTAEVRLVNASSGANVFFLHHVSSEEQIREWAFSGLRLARSQCGPEFEALDLVEIPDPLFAQASENFQTFGGRCGSRQGDELDRLVLDMVNNMMAKVSFVNADNSTVLQLDGLPELEQTTGQLLLATGVRNLDDFPLFTRRAPIVGVGALLVILAVALGLRTLSGVCVPNDVAVAVGTVLRRGLGLPCADSMLGVEDTRVHHETDGGNLSYRRRTDAATGRNSSVIRGAARPFVTPARSGTASWPPSPGSSVPRGSPRACGQFRPPPGRGTANDSTRGLARWSWTARKCPERCRTGCSQSTAVGAERARQASAAVWAASRG
ncbi:hypothetical protein FGB62_244g01 [Gracilaria domingensis]|nr:hypothetical protein FGB62_393g05 [Gracilaria domingensis]KAI0557982.1 hypothetical protein FGB62_244g01 [Gracilaria domingensis]